MDILVGDDLCGQLVLAQVSHGFALPRLDSSLVGGKPSHLEFPPVPKGTPKLHKSPRTLLAFTAISLMPVLTVSSITAFLGNCNLGIIFP